MPRCGYCMIGNLETFLELSRRMSVESQNQRWEDRLAASGLPPSAANLGAWLNFAFGAMSRL